MMIPLIIHNNASATTDTIDFDHISPIPSLAFEFTQWNHTFCYNPLSNLFCNSYHNILKLIQLHVFIVGCFKEESTVSAGKRPYADNSLSG